MLDARAFALGFILLAACAAPTADEVEVADLQESALGGSKDCPTPPPVRPATKVVMGTFHDGVWTFEGRAPFVFGKAGDVPLVGDWNGDGRDEVGVFRADANGYGQFSLDMDGDGVWNGSTDRVATFGYGTDTPIAGDWSGSGRAKIGVFRNAGGLGQFSLDMDGDGVWSWSADRVTTFGYGTDVPIAGDWTGSGRARIGVFRAGEVGLDLDGDGVWNPAVDRVGAFGGAGDRPVVAPWASGARSQLAVVRPDGSGRLTWSIDVDGDLRWNPPVDRWTTYGSGAVPVAIRQ